MGYETDKAELNGAEPYYGPAEPYGPDGPPLMGKPFIALLIFLMFCLILASIFCDSEEQIAKKQAAEDQFVDYGY